MRKYKYILMLVFALVQTLTASAVWDAPTSRLTVDDIIHAYMKTGGQRLSVEHSGGNPDGWSVTWGYDYDESTATGDTFTLPETVNKTTKLASYEVTVRCVNTDTLKAEETVPGTLYDKTYKITVNVYPEASFTVGNTANTTDFYKEVKNATFSINQQGGYASGWTYSWSFNNATGSGQQFVPSYSNTATDTKQFALTVTVRNVGPDGAEYLKRTETINLTVYPEATASAISGQTYFYKNIANGQWTVDFTDKGGNPNGWEVYEWKFDNVSCGKSATLVRSTANATKTERHTILAYVRNMSPDNKTAWYDNKSNPLSLELTVYPEATSILNTTATDYYVDIDNATWRMDTSEGNPCGWDIEWKVNGEQKGTGDTFRYSYNNNSDEKKVLKIEATARNLSPNGDVWYTKTYPVDVTVYAKAQTMMTGTTDFYVDIDNTWRIDATNGNPDGWDIKWKIDGEQKGTGGTFRYAYTNNTDEKQVLRLEATARNLSPSGDVWYTQTYPVELTVYSRALPKIVGETNFYRTFGNQKLVLDRRGGNPDGWHIDGWKFNGQTYESEIFTLPAYENTSSMIETYTIEASVRNVSPDGSEDWFSGTETLQLSIYPLADCSFEGDINAKYQQKLPNGALGILTGQYNEDTGNWRYEWCIDGVTSGTAPQLPAIINNSESKKTVKIDGKATYLAPDGATVWDTFAQSYNVTIYATPKIKMEPVIGYMGSELPVKLTLSAYEPESVWTIDWYYGGEELLEFKNKTNVVIKLPYDAKEDYILKRLTASATNTVEEYGQPFEMADGGVAYVDCSAYSRGTVPKEINIESPDLYSGQGTTLSISETGGYPGGWNFEWSIDGGNFVKGTHTYDFQTTPFNGDCKDYTLALHVYNKISDNKVGIDTVLMAKTITVWPICEFPDAIKMLDDNRDRESTDFCIREGNGYTMKVASPRGGYYRNGSKNYWLDGKIPDGDSFINHYTAGMSDGNTKEVVPQDYSCLLTNGLSTNNIWAEKTLTQQIRVYRKPKSPTSLVVMGNGNTGTLIATMPIADSQLDRSNAEYHLVFGYIDGSGNEHETEPIAQGGTGTTRWYTYPDPNIVKNRNNKFYVYSLWKYADAEVTSGRIFVGDSKANEQWDGSLFGGELPNRNVTRGDETLGIDNVTMDGDSCTEHIYTLDGHVVDKSSKLRPGIYIKEVIMGTFKTQTKFIIK